MLVGAAALLLAVGRRPSSLAAGAAAALVLLGGWSVLSTAWGGLPHDAWRFFDEALIGGAALLCGSALAWGPKQRAVVLAGVLAGITAQAIEVLGRLALDRHPADWLHDRFLQGPVGYHNAQGVFFAVGVPLALWAAGRSPMIVRIAGGISGGLLLGALLLTQSRAALIALGVGVIVQLAFARSVRLIWLSALFVWAGLALGFALSRVDAALLEGTPSEQIHELRIFVLWTVLAALSLGALATLTPGRTTTRILALAATASLVAALAVVGVREDRFPGSDFTLSGLVSDEAPKASPGQTRIVSLSLNGRKEAWRVARQVISAHPVAGAGQGQFARSWTKERRLTNLYILQPHSLELELLSELGIVGLALFAAFAVVAVVAVLRSPGRPMGAAALGSAAVLLTQASVDWTWSFPALVAPVLLVLGAAAGGRAGPPQRWLLKGALAAAALAAVVSFAAPYAAQAELSRASDVQAEPERAWDRAETARRLDPWSPQIWNFEARLATRMGDLALAADRYGRAAELSQRPWLERFRQATVLALAGKEGESRAACREAVAENPGEPTLQGGPCLGDLLVSTSSRRLNAVPLEGATLRGIVYVFATGAARKLRVSFFIDDPELTGRAETTETSRPYDLAGTESNASKTAKPFDTAMLENGRHVLTARINLPSGRKVIVEATFRVENPGA